jgi:hypothetical protein
MHPTTELELCLVLLPHDIQQCERALRIRAKSVGSAARHGALVAAIMWQKAAQKQLATALNAAAYLEHQEGYR